MLLAISLASGDATFADFLTGWGTISLAIVTVAAVIVTIWIAKTDRRRDDERRAQDRADAEQRVRKERDERRRAQARLVLTGNPGLRATGKDDDGYHYDLTFPFTNHGDRPVVDVHADAWPVREPLEEPAKWGVNTRVALPGQDLPLVIKIIKAEPDESLNAWRVRWTDADGREWCVDQREQPEPLPFTGQPPRLYT